MYLLHALIEDIFGIPMNTPVIGSKYWCYPESPFDEPFSVTPVEIKGIYVKYSFGYGTESSCRISVFNSIYKRKT
jgi:hypothetical protein